MGLLLLELYVQTLRDSKWIPAEFGGKLTTPLPTAAFPVTWRGQWPSASQPLVGAPTVEAGEHAPEWPFPSPRAVTGGQGVEGFIRVEP